MCLFCCVNVVLICVIIIIYSIKILSQNGWMKMCISTVASVVTDAILLFKNIVIIINEHGEKNK